MTDQRFRVNVPKVISEAVGGDVVVINLETRTYYTLVGLGARIWQALESGASAAEIVSQVEACFSTEGTDAVDAVSALVDDLVTEGLLVPHDVIPVEPPRPVVADVYGAPFEMPLLHRFTDMQGLGGTL